MEIEQWYFVLLEGFLEYLLPTQQDIVSDPFSLCLLNKSVLYLCSSLHLRTFTPHRLIIFCRPAVGQNCHASCLLSVQRPAVKSCGAPSREVQKRGWPWKWGTGWPDRQAESLRTAAWTAIALKESEWGRPWCASPPCLACDPLLSLSLSLCFPQKLTHTLHSTICIFPGWFAAKRTSFLLTYHWETWPVRLFKSREIGLGKKCFALTARR